MKDKNKEIRKLIPVMSENSETGKIDIHMSKQEWEERTGLINDPNRERKNKFLEYYAVLPIQKLGAEHIGVDEDTITNWKKEDKWFSDQIGYLKSEWAKKMSTRVRNPEWLLERITRDHFAPPQQKTDITSDGQKLEGLVIIKDKE